MKSKFILWWILFGMVLTGASPIASQTTGSADMTLDGGKRGKVAFPHQKHIDTLADCNICHDLFPTTAGIIDELKAQGKLEKKQVMNSQCTKCHRARKKAGNRIGPTTCGKCHVR